MTDSISTVRLLKTILSELKGLAAAQVMLRVAAASLLACLSDCGAVSKRSGDPAPHLGHVDCDVGEVESGDGGGERVHGARAVQRLHQAAQRRADHQTGRKGGGHLPV